MLRKFSGKSENCEVLETRTNQPKILKIPRPKSNDAEQYGNFEEKKNGLPQGVFLFFWKFWNPFQSIRGTFGILSWLFSLLLYLLSAPIEICVCFQHIKDRLCKRGLASVWQIRFLSHFQFDQL